MRAWTFLLPLLVGCKKSPSAEPLVDFGEFTVVDDAALSEPGSRPVGPGDWEGEGLSLFVPPGWSGVEGPRPLLLAIVNRTTAVSLSVYAFDEPLGAPRVVEGEECGFVDSQRFRSVPALGHSQTATCIGDEITRQVWWAVRGEREIHVEATYPRGRAVRGRQDVAPMLDGLESVAPTEPGEQQRKSEVEQP